MENKQNSTPVNEIDLNLFVKNNFEEGNIFSTTITVHDRESGQKTYYIPKNEAIQIKSFQKECYEAIMRVESKVLRSSIIDKHKFSQGDYLDYKFGYEAITNIVNLKKSEWLGSIESKLKITDLDEKETQLIAKIISLLVNFDNEFTVSRAQEILKEAIEIIPIAKSLIK